MPERDVPERSAFRHWVREVCRYGDTDRQGHVNNAVFATFCESGRVGFLRLGEPRLVPAGFEFVIVRLTINFRRELMWGDVVDIGTDVSRIGNSSLVAVQGLFRGGECVADAESVLVMMDAQTRKSAPLPTDLRERLSRGD
jgi:acyl-CoA thioester hydrolase